MTSNPKLAVCSCLLKKRIRHDGENAELRGLNQDWSESFELVEVCPDVELGMGVSSSALRLIKDQERISLINPENGEDHTETMAKYAEEKSDELVASGISGFVFSKDSPVFGLERVKVYRGDNPKAVQDGSGLFAKVFTTLYPHIPVIEEGKLNDPSQVEHFLSRVQFFHEWHKIGDTGWTELKLKNFHRENENFLRSRAPLSKKPISAIMSELSKGEQHPENLAFYYMTEAQKYLSTLTKSSISIQPLKRTAERLPQVTNLTKKSQVM